MAEVAEAAAVEVAAVTVVFSFHFANFFVLFFCHHQSLKAKGIAEFSRPC